MPVPPKRTGPLTRLKVLEIGHYIAAPFCTRILADLGAEVIKIEPPGGDPFRGWGAAVDGHSVWFSVHGRNKLSVVLDLKRDRDTVLKLAARADVLVENLRPGGLERLGLASRIAYEFSIAEMLPAVGQGIVAVECAAQDWQTRRILSAIDDPAAHKSADAEREVLWVLNGHCNSPIAGFSTIDGAQMSLTASVLDETGGLFIEASRSGPADRPRELGRAVGLELLARGAADIIERSRVR